MKTFDWLRKELKLLKSKRKMLYTVEEIQLYCNIKSRFKSFQSFYLQDKMKKLNRWWWVCVFHRVGRSSTSFLCQTWGPGLRSLTDFLKVCDISVDKWECVLVCDASVCIIHACVCVQVVRCASGNTFTVSWKTPSTADASITRVTCEFFDRTCSSSLTLNSSHNRTHTLAWRKRTPSPRKYTCPTPAA